MTSSSPDGGRLRVRRLGARWPGAAAVALCAVTAVVAAGGEGVDPPATLDLRGGGAWVASSAVGQLTLIDGGTAEVAARVAVAEPGGDLGSVQDGIVGFALDRTVGVVRRVDPATFAAAPGVEVVEGARGDLSAHPSGDVMYVVDHTRGRVGVADGGALSSLRGEVQSLAEPVASSVVDADGRLWVLGETTGDLTWFDGPERSSRRAAVADPGTAELVVVDGDAAVVERAGRLVRSIDDGGGFRSEACLEIDPSDRSIRVGGSERAERLYVVSGDDGVLRVSELDSGDCGDVVVEVADPGNDLGAPQESRGRVFVPDFTAGTVIVVDLESRRVTRTAELVTPGTAFELFDRDGIVFYNDPGSERAGVVRVDGSFAAVEKYDPERPGAGVVPEGGRQETAVPDAAASSPGDGAGIDDRGVDGTDPGGEDRITAAATSSTPSTPGTPAIPGPRLPAPTRPPVPRTPRCPRTRTCRPTRRTPRTRSRAGSRSPARRPCRWARRRRSRSAPPAGDG